MFLHAKCSSHIQKQVKCASSILNQPKNHKSNQVFYTDDKLYILQYIGLAFYLTTYIVLQASLAKDFRLCIFLVHYSNNGARGETNMHSPKILCKYDKGGFGSKI